MIDTKYFTMHQRRETIQPKRKPSSKNNHLANSNKIKASLRRTCSDGLPSIASNTVKMVIATLQIGDTMTDLYGGKVDTTDEQQKKEDDDDYDDILNIGQDVKSHLPNIVLHNLNDFIDRKDNILIPNEHAYDNTTLLFLDVSGFTALTEQYSNDAHLGIGQLTRTLNSYFAKLVYEILTHHGDIYKFAGDAILALWVNGTTGPEQALKCALHLQQKCGAYETDVGVILHVKVALAYGPVQALFVGTDEFRHYLLRGDCVKDVNVCEQLCEPGDIIMTKAAYEQLQSVSIDCEFVPVSDDIDPNHEHIAVKYSQSGRSSLNEDSDTEDHMSSTTIVNDRMNKANREIINDDHNHQLSSDDSSVVEPHRKFDSLMKSFLLRCVSQRIERQQSLYYLSELRRVTISFINLDLTKEPPKNEKLYEIFHKVFLQIYELTKMLGGVLTKALLFDKGLSFLCVFGLPGYKQGDDTANALKSAQLIHSKIQEQCKFVKKCSIGVTTGLTYCGVVGHQARCEYTVIGRKVNMAARLMCNYPNVISCDQETYYNSRLNSRFFQILPDKPLKGMNNVGIIRQYSDCHDIPQVTEQNKTHNRQTNDIRQEEYPLLGRKVELMIVAAQITLLDEPLNSPKRRDRAAIIFEGEDKIGRSRLLQFITESLVNLATVNNIPINNDEIEPTSSLDKNLSDSSMIKKSTIQVINHVCQFEQRFNEFGLLRSLLRQLLKFHTNEKSQHEREQYFSHLFDMNKTDDLHLRRNLFLLNDLLDVKFPRHHIETENVSDQNLVKTYEANINELILHILNKLIESPNKSGESHSSTSGGSTTNKSCTTSQSRISSGSTLSSTIPTVSKIIFIVDDIHFADESSLKHLLTLGSHSKCLLILSMKPRTNNNNDRTNSNILQSISTDSRVYLRRLPGLELRYLATLGCQMLNVHRVPTKLVKVFNESCNGIPGFCEQILNDLLSKDQIHIVDNNYSHDQDADLIEGDPDKLLLNNPIKMGLFKTFFSRRKQQITQEQCQKERAFSHICLLRDPSQNEFNADCQQNFQNYIMCRIDRLSDGESLLVKVAAVIGNSFSRTFLTSLVNPQSKNLINISSCILEMMQRTIIECAFSKQQKIKTRSIKCYCLQNPGGFPSQCRLMAFTHSTIREGIYNALTDGLKRLLTRNAIDYLEKQPTIVCLTCGANRNDSPFLVDDRDGLAKIIKNRQQHAFVDIVKIAALKEIDNTIKQVSRLPNSPDGSRSNKLSLAESVSVPNARLLDSKTDDSDNNQDKRHSSLGSASTEEPSIQRDLSQFSSLIEDDLSSDEATDAKHHDLSLRRNSSDPNLTLISLFSPNAPPNVHVNVQRSSLSSTSPARSSELFSLFKVPTRENLSTEPSNTETLKTVDGTVSNQNSKKNKSVVGTSEKQKNDKPNRFFSFFRFLFCQFMTLGGNATVTPINDNLITEDNQVLSTLPPKEIETPTNAVSHWKQARKAILPSQSKVVRIMPSEDELLQQSMFSFELMEKFSTDLNSLNKQTSLVRIFENLYNQSFIFHTFQSYSQYASIIQYAYELKPNEQQVPDLNKFINGCNSYVDLRLCECPDYVMTVYIKLVEYHTNLYDIYEKTVDEKRNCILLKQFHRIMYYQAEICQLLLGCDCFQHLLVEIENGRKLLEKFQNDINNQEDFIFHYPCFIIKYMYNFFQATLLQHSKSVHDSKLICEQSLKELNEAYQEKIWEKLIINRDIVDSTSVVDKREHYEHHKQASEKENSVDSNSSIQSIVTNSDQYILFNGKYRLEYLLCQYNLLQYNLSHHESIESLNTLIDLQYYTFPLSFSLPCTITLVEYFYGQQNYDQCLLLINKLIQIWWSYINPREKFEFAKLKCLSLIIELKQGSLDSAILSGYFAKRILTGCHENIFLIESCIHLTLALIGEMRISNIELILQHLEYLSEQTMNCYAKLWYYILIVDTAIDLGYELLPITLDLLNNIAKYRKKLHSGSHETSLLLVYSDCVLSQAYARLGFLDMSKIHFHQVLHQIKYEYMHLSHVDFRLKRSFLKLIEVQLIHWYYREESDDQTTIDDFLLKQFNHEDFIGWNKSRFFIYQAYYDRLVNDYKREENISIDNDFNWELSLCEAENHAIKLDKEWINRLRNAWLYPVSEHYSLQGKSSKTISQSRRSTLEHTPGNRPFNRLSVPLIPLSSKNDVNNGNTTDEQIETIHSYPKQKFTDCPLFLNNNNLSQFHLYILPVKV